MGSLRPRISVEIEASVGAVAAFPGETRFKGIVFRGSFESAGPIISAHASHTLYCMVYSLLAPQMTTEAEVVPRVWNHERSGIPTGSEEKDLT